MALTKRPLFDPPIVRRATRDAFAKTVNLRHMVRNPVMFVVLLIGVILIVGALTFFPALSLGPIVEHLLMNAGRIF